uniref:Potassium transporter n=1 Tax=Ananas comosus var. bracteatus TaxID=296719 RepID=A0A6V7NNZ6_ANACO|nr:unnamed protein product [Ananas comosus var. bracteatus]
MGKEEEEEEVVQGVVLNIETMVAEEEKKKRKKKKKNTNGDAIEGCDGQEEEAEKELAGEKHFTRIDSLEFKEANHVSGMHSASKVLPIAAVLQLAFQSIGVVYGDIGTSPLYVFASTFADRVPTRDDVVGALSLIIYSLTLFPLVKYVFIVLWRMTMEMVSYSSLLGGTFAMYSLICRHANVNAIPNQQAEALMDLSAYKLQTPNKHLKRAEKVKGALERSSWAKNGLLSLALLGTCMVIGDGILTPCISVLSAVDGVRKIDAGISKDVIAMISVAILVVLFSIQRFGTDKVGYTFAPAILVWYVFIGTIGLSNLVRHDSSVLKAFNPLYIVSYFRHNAKEAWISLGGVVLCMTGTEAMFADLGHFSVRSIQIAFTGLVYPCLICAYVGQAAYLSYYPLDVADAFYKSTPELVYWPMFVIAILASIIASQAMISATFAIIKQSVALGCFPRVRVIHTSNKHEGQVYIPEINFLLMLACVLVTASFKETTKIGNAYGIAVVAVMIVTSSLLILIMLMIWQTSLILIALFVLVFYSFELLYFSSVLYKFGKGGYLPLSFAAVLFFVMYVWHYVQKKRHAFEVERKVSTEYVSSLGSNLGISRVPGVGLLYTELTQGIPAIFPHFLTNLPAIHSVLVFVSVKYLPVNKVLPEERFFCAGLGLKGTRCIGASHGTVTGTEGSGARSLKGYLWSISSPSFDPRIRKPKGRIVVDHVYDFLRRNCRQGFVDLQIPNKNLLQVGMNYYI